MKYNKNEEPIILSKPTLDLLLSQERPADLIALYTFYYYTAKWQKTDQPKCTTGYTSEGLNWSEERVQKNKQTLLELGLIENFKTFGEGNRITGHYILLHLFWTHSDIKKAVMNMKATPPISQGVENLGGNAYNLKSNSLNALKEITKEKKPIKTNRIKRTKQIPLPLNRPKRPVIPFIELFPPNYQKDEDFKTIWISFIEHRKEIKAKLTNRAVLLIVNEIKKYQADNIPETIKRFQHVIKAGKIAPYLEPWKDKQPVTNSPTKPPVNPNRVGRIGPDDTPDRYSDADYARDNPIPGMPRR